MSRQTAMPGSDIDTIDNRGRSSRWICSEWPVERRHRRARMAELPAEARAALMSLMSS